MARSERTTGLNKNSSTIMQYSGRSEALPVSRLVALTADFVQTFQERQKLVEILQALNVFFANVFTPLASHALNMPYFYPGRKSK
jgi:hypothetical protein